MAVVHLPTSLVSLFPGAPRHVQVEAGSVRELLDRLDDRWPGMRFRLCDAGPVIREHIHVFVDGEMSALGTPLGPGAVVHVITAVSGGQGTVGPSGQHNERRSWSQLLLVLRADATRRS
jgi:sulfur-carrier protein